MFKLKIALIKNINFMLITISIYIIVSFSDFFFGRGGIPALVVPTNFKSRV